MAEILTFQARAAPVRAIAPAPRPAAPPRLPRLHDDLRRRAGLFAAACSILLSGLGFALVLLVAAVLRYDGAFLGIGSDGLCIGAHACGGAPFAHLGHLSAVQRTVLAIALSGLCAPALMILAHLRGLFRLYAAGIVFDPDNMARISRVGVWLLAYAALPFPMHQLLAAFRVLPGQSWFRTDEAAAAIIGLSLLLLARVIACGGELEQQRDLYM